ncbi:hypothetical protein BHE74_00045209 [Ensete ventricosum]|nr:hypothetical protein BHE74_00045209 [Ensete ventricosum]
MCLSCISCMRGDPPSGFVPCSFFDSRTSFYTSSNCQVMWHSWVRSESVESNESRARSGSGSSNELPSHPALAITRRPLMAPRLVDILLGQAVRKVEGSKESVVGASRVLEVLEVGLALVAEFVVQELNVDFLFVEVEVSPRFGSACVHWSVYMALVVESELGICSERCLPKNVGFLFAEVEVSPRLGSARVRWSIYVASIVEFELGIRSERCLLVRYEVHRFI